MCKTFLTCPHNKKQAFGVLGISAMAAASSMQRRWVQHPMNQKLYIREGSCEWHKLHDMAVAAHKRGRPAPFWAASFYLSDVTEIAPQPTTEGSSVRAEAERSAEKKKDARADKDAHGDKESSAKNEKSPGCGEYQCFVAPQKPPRKLTPSEMRANMRNIGRRGLNREVYV